MSIGQRARPGASLSLCLSLSACLTGAPSRLVEARVTAAASAAVAAGSVILREREWEREFGTPKLRLCCFQLRFLLRRKESRHDALVPARDGPGACVCVFVFVCLCVCVCICVCEHPLAWLGARPSCPQSCGRALGCHALLLFLISVTALNPRHALSLPSHPRPPPPCPPSRRTPWPYASYCGPTWWTSHGRR